MRKFVYLNIFKYIRGMPSILVNNVRGNQVTETFNFVLEECCNCGIPFFLTASFYKECQNNPDRWFFCPNGHTQHYTKSKSQIKIDELEKSLEFAKKDRQDVENALMETISEKNKLSRQLKRVHRGVCPCCNRTFENLQKHMASKHPLEKIAS